MLERRKRAGSNSGRDIQLNCQKKFKQAPESGAGNVGKLVTKKSEETLAINAFCLKKKKGGNGQIGVR